MRQDAVILYCTRCDTGYASCGHVPPQCPACGKETRWTTTAPKPDTTRIPYLLNANDRAWLQKHGIKS